MHVDIPHIWSILLQFCEISQVATTDDADMTFVAATSTTAYKLSAHHIQTAKGVMVTTHEVSVLA
jgi:hypothetical protein